MKNVIVLAAILLTASCAPMQSNLSPYQSKNITRFNSGKSNRGVSGPRYVSTRKNGSWNHPAVKKETRKSLKQARQ